MADLDTRDPSKLFIQADNVRRYIISAYWLVILLALPLWWSTTSIERLSLPSLQVTSQAHRRLRIPVRISLDIDPDGSSVATQLQSSINERVRRTPERWEGLQIHVYNLQDEHFTGTGEVYRIVRSEGVSIGHSRQLEYPIVELNSELRTLCYHIKASWNNEALVSELTDTLGSLIAPYPTIHEQDHRVVQYSPRYRLSFTLLNEDAAAGNSVSGWDIAGAITR